MALPRSSYVNDDEVGVYHCFSRCVRRAFLCGFDPVTHRDYSHRKTWVVDRLHQLSDIFAIDVCAYAVMDNHYHTVLRTRPDIAASWSDLQVAARWLTLFPHYKRKKYAVSPPTDIRISALASCPDRIAVFRKRLSSLSWFMARLNEFIARAANKEDNVKGRFWESRFSGLALLDDAAITACMVYVDLNPMRAGLAPSPEQSLFASIQERIRAWYNDHRSTAVVPGEPAPTIPPDSFSVDRLQLQRTPGPSPERIPADSPAPSTSWLCPIQSTSLRRGILSMTPAEYLHLVDQSGRILRSDNRRDISPDLAPILLRIRANPQAWVDTISHFQARFRLAAGLLSSLRSFAHHIGRRWLSGVASARTAFAVSPTQEV
jgi:putative transposase